MKEQLSLEAVLQELTPLFEQYASKDNIITERNVYKHENPHIREIVNSLIKKVLRENSCMYPSEHLSTFFDAVNSGKKGIILAEHYSNLDLPILLYLMEQTGEIGTALSKRTVSIAGMKLTEQDFRIAALTEGYERIVIYPSRSLAGISDPEKLQEEQKRSRSINLAAMKALEEARQAGKVIIVFPAGTRYRPGMPETKRGVREIDSYIRSSDVMLLVSINGNCLRISDNPAHMTEDVVVRDTLTMEVSPVIQCADFRAQAKAQCGANDDKKQAVVDMVMAELERMHNRNESIS